jgi:glutamate/tyrosine decarboxylase-like PLP-dependent enzyme
MINKAEIRILQTALETLQSDNAGLPAFTPDFDEAAVQDVLERVAVRMQDNFPFYHPHYAGQMLKPPHPVARIAYALSLWVNPNNHALDGGRASSIMEKECVQELAQMFGWRESLGHLTGGGTIANLEALWVASRLHPGKRIVASAQAHYTHSRVSDVLGIEFASIPVDNFGRMDMEALEANLRQGDVGTVVATMGNTGLGTVDPLLDIVALQQQYGFRIHADAAYGGYFGLTSLLDADTKTAFDAITAVDSVVIDPHKHGLQPYGCGCILYKDASVGTIYKHESPYTYFSSAELHLGEISLECSRPGAAAVALWATLQLLPLQVGGEFSSGLEASLRAARELHRQLMESEFFVPLMPPELDIVVYAVAAGDSQTASSKARRVFELAAERGLHLALIDLPFDLSPAWSKSFDRNSETICCLRSVLMKSAHEDWIPSIVRILQECAAEVN